jgi:hypothetical protein
MDQVGVSAVRALGVDVGNLSATLAVQTAIVSRLIDLASQITPMAWEHQAITDGSEVLPDGSTIVTVTGDEADRVVNLVGEILALRQG